jgi:hypothetical protein
MVYCQKCGKNIEYGEKLYAKGRLPDLRYKKILCEKCATKERKKANCIRGNIIPGGYGK